MSLPSSIIRHSVWAVCAVCIALLVDGSAAAADPLPSWNEGAATAAITGLVTRVTKEGGAD